MKTFGPVQTRRFGMSLGINHLPPKVCSYDCIYCQLGRTDRLEIKSAAYSQPEIILQAVETHLQKISTRPDYLTFVSNGEPTLDINLGKAIEILKPLKIKIGVISNASLLWQKEIQLGLSAADAVSIKIDSTNEKVWRRINRPHEQLQFEKVLEGIREFASNYRGRLLTETMLMRNINDSPELLQGNAQLIAELDPEIAYLALPLRAPSERWVESPDEATQAQALQIYSQHIKRCALLGKLPPTRLEGADDAPQALLETIQVHPMEREEVLSYLRALQQSEDILEDWMRQNKVRASVYQGKTFYAAEYPTENKPNN
jgi:wyosine [tRNA(Phe)-imidazoG37] synthetase (radical SAM superfamily)